MISLQFPQLKHERQHVIKCFGPGKGKHHMVMHDDRHEGNIMYLRERGEDQPRGRYLKMLRARASPRSLSRVFSSFLLSSRERVKFTAHIRASCLIYLIYILGISYKRRIERGSVESNENRRGVSNEILIYDVNHDAGID